MIKILILLVFGAVETYLFAWWNLATNRYQEWQSSIAMFIHMIVYLFAIKMAINPKAAFVYIIVYSFACAIGNYIRVHYEKKKIDKIKDKRDFIIKGI